jgi:hypothetical protein
MLVIDRASLLNQPLWPRPSGQTTIFAAIRPKRNRDGRAIERSLDEMPA